MPNDLAMNAASCHDQGVCGRLNMASDPADIGRELDVEYERYAFSPRYNVPPGSALPIVLDSVGATGEIARRLETAGWGLVPGWAKDLKIGFRAFNARSETVADKPMFRSAFVRRRCVIPVCGYYEWAVEAGEKIPWLMHGDSWLFLAGLYEFAKCETLDVSESDPRVTDGWYVSTTILTMPSRGHLESVHDRMPVVLGRSGVERWCEPTETKADALGVLDSVLHDVDVDQVKRYRVSSAVGNVRNDGPELMEPVEG